MLWSSHEPNKSIHIATKSYIIWPTLSQVQKGGNEVKEGQNQKGIGSNNSLRKHLDHQSSQMSCSDCCWKTCSCSFFRSIKNGQEEKKIDFTKLFIKVLSLSELSLAQVWVASHCGLLVFRRMAERMGLLAHQEEEEQFEREESRYHMYNSAAIVLFLTVLIAYSEKGSK